MDIKEINQLYAGMPQAGALVAALGKGGVRSLALEGLVGSAAPVVFASVAGRLPSVLLFVLADADDAGYFYHDLVQLLGDGNVLFFPSSYRRAVKYGQRDAASEILRTEVLARVAGGTGEGPSVGGGFLYIVSYPDAVAELVVSRKRLDSRRVELSVGQSADVGQLSKTLVGFGFKEVDYVYEPGQFARRGSIFDVYSYSCEFPFRIDFFGDDIDSIRTFEVETQLSRETRDRIEIVPELAGLVEGRVPLLSFLPADAVLVARDFAFVRDSVARIYDEGFSRQAVAERMEGLTEMEQKAVREQMRKDVQLVSPSVFADSASGFRQIELGRRHATLPEATITFDTTPQPLFHKNFNLLHRSLEDYVLKGYRLFILADSQKQNERLKEILGARNDAGGGTAAAVEAGHEGAAHGAGAATVAPGCLR